MKFLEGQSLETQCDIEQELVNLYTDLLSETDEERVRDTITITRNILKLVTPEHSAMLMNPIEWEEVDKEVFQMEKGNALALDGFTIDFFQECKDLVKEEVWEIMEESRRIGRVLKAFN